MWLINPGEERGLGVPSSSVMVSMRKLLGRWSQAAQRDEVITNTRHKLNHDMFRPYVHYEDN